jgi:hypothetical protein
MGDMSVTWMSGASFQSGVIPEFTTVTWFNHCDVFYTNPPILCRLEQVIYPCSKYIIEVSKPRQSQPSIIEVGGRGEGLPWFSLLPPHSARVSQLIPESGGWTYVWMSESVNRTQGLKIMMISRRWLLKFFSSYGLDRVSCCTSD